MLVLYLVIDHVNSEHFNQVDEVSMDLQPVKTSVTKDEDSNPSIYVNAGETIA